MTKPNLNLLNEMALDIYKMEKEAGLQAVQLKDVKKGEYIKRKPDAKKVFTKGEYCRFDKKYSCDDWEDISRCIMLKGSTIVYVGFDF
jgi:hypothetical protein